MSLLDSARRARAIGCRHVRWPRAARPVVWSTSATRLITAEDSDRLVHAAVTRAAAQGLRVVPRTVHVCRVSDARWIWVAVARPVRPAGGSRWWTAVVRWWRRR